MTQRIPLDVRQQAAEWLVELQDENANEETHVRWLHWRDAHSDHALAWQRIESFGEKLQALPSPIAHATLSPAVSINRRQAISVMTMVLLAGGAAWYTRDQVLWQKWRADYRVAKGERRSIILADGTAIELNSDTALNVRYSKRQRLVRLLQGEIMVTTAHKVSKSAGTAWPPFVVQTEQGIVRALGTRFTVRQLDSLDQSHVGVFEGAVVLSPRKLDPIKTVEGDGLIRAGQAAHFTTTDISAATPVNEDAAAWVGGMIIASDMSLSIFLAELSRYHPQRVSCETVVAHLKVSGTYPLINTGQVIDMLQTSYQLRAEKKWRWWGGDELILAPQ